MKNKLRDNIIESLEKDNNIVAINLIDVMTNAYYYEEDITCSLECYMFHDNTSECFNEAFSHKEPFDIMQLASNSNYNFDDRYFRYDGWENLESFESFDDVIDCIFYEIDMILDILLKVYSEEKLYNLIFKEN